MSKRVARSRTAYSLAVAQHGVVSRRQLRRADFSPGTIRSWLETGRLIPILPGVYALGRPAIGNEATWMAGTLAAGSTATLAERAAAAAHGFGDPPAIIEVVRAEGRPRMIHGRHPHGEIRVDVRRRTLQPEETCRLGPIPATSIDRTLCDLAEVLAEAKLRRCFLEAGRAGLLTPDCLTRIESTPRLYRGRARLRNLVDKWDPTKGKLRSLLEAEFRLMCAEQGLPVPDTNESVGRHEVDAIWWPARLIVELDSRRFHADQFALERDSAKTRELRQMGFRVLRFTWEQIVSFPEEVAAIIRRELAAAAPGLLAQDV